MKPAWVYILECNDGSFYTGHTTDLELRVAQHKAGKGGQWTRKRQPVTVVFSQEMPDKDSAFQAERRIKGWSRAKKEALIANNWDLVVYLAKKPQFRTVSKPSR